MRVTERIIDNPDAEGVILEYVSLTNDFAEIKEYVLLPIPPQMSMRSKADCIRWRSGSKEAVYAGHQRRCL